MSGRQPRAGVFNIFEGSQSIQHIPALLTNGAGSVRLRRALLGPLVCRHLVTGACHPAWRSGIAGDRMGRCAVLGVAHGWERAAPATRALPSRLPSHECLRCWLEPRKGWASVLGPACPACARDPSGCKAAPAQPWGWLYLCPGASTAFFSAAHRSSMWLQCMSQCSHTIEPLGLRCSLWPAATLLGGMESWGDVAGQPAGRSAWGDHKERAGSGFGSMRACLGGRVWSGSGRRVVDVWQWQERVRNSLPPPSRGEDT